MTALRRIVNVVMGAIFIAVVGYLIYMEATGQVPAEQQPKFIGAAILIGALVVCSVFTRFRRRDDVPSRLIDDPTAVIDIRLPVKEVKVFAAVLFLLAIGSGITLLAGDLDFMSRIFAWAGVLLFGGLFVFFLLRPQQVSLRLSPEGIDYTVFRTGPIAWRDIRAATISTRGKFKYVALDVANPQSYLASRTKSFWHFLEQKPFTFVPPNSGVSPETIVSAIEVRLSTFGRSGPGRVTLE